MTRRRTTTTTTTDDGAGPYAAIEAELRRSFSDLEHAIRSSIRTEAHDRYYAAVMLPQWGAALATDAGVPPVLRALRWAIRARADAKSIPAPACMRLDELSDAERGEIQRRTTARAAEVWRGIANVAAVARAIEHVEHVEAGAAWPPVAPSVRIEALPAADGMFAPTRDVLEGLRAYVAAAPVEHPSGHDGRAAWLRDGLDREAERARDEWATGAPLRAWDLRVGDLDRGPAWLGLVALAVWTLELEPATAHARRPAAFRLPVVEAILETLSRPRRLRDGGDLVADTPHASRPVASYPDVVTADPAYLERVTAGVGRLTHPLAPRVVVYVAHAIQRRISARDPIVWAPADGWSAWERIAAEVLDSPERPHPSHVRDVRDLVHAIGPMHFRGRDGSMTAGLWTTYTSGDPTGGRGNTSIVTLTPNAGLFTSNAGDYNGRSSFLTPLPRLPGWAPPGVGRVNDAGASARLWLWFLVQLRDQAEDLARGHGGAALAPADWVRGAAHVGMTHPGPLAIVRYLDVWKGDNARGAAVLEELTPGRYNLAPQFAAERAMLEEGGRRSIANAKRGRTSAAKRKPKS